MLRSVVSPAVSALAVVALAAACGGSTNASQGGFTNPGSDASANVGDDDSGSGTLGGGDTNVGDGGLISIDPGDGGNSGVTGGLDAGCASATSTTSRTPVYLQFVLDGSGSMMDDNKWPTAVKALKAIFSSIEMQNDPTVGVGLEVFADSKDPSSKCGLTSCTYGNYPSSADVAIREVDSTQLGKLTSRMSGMPYGGTPTNKALSGSYTYASGFTPSAPLQSGGKKVVVIITDGIPNDGSSSSTTAQQNAVIASATSAATNGLETFVIGVGPFEYEQDDYDPKFLGALAVAGGTSKTGCNPNELKNVANACYFQVTPSSSTDYTQEFIDAINDIRGEIASCTYQLNIADAGSVDPTKVNVIYTDGMGVVHTLVQDATNGWTYDNPTMPTEVILHGTDCSAVKSDPNGKVDIVLGCTTVTPTGPR